jgi:hypothetical protein
MPEVRSRPVTDPQTGADGAPTTAPIGLIVNPRSGNDVRRVIAAAGSSTLEDKVSIIRRVVIGAREVGAARFITQREPHQIVRRATETMRGVRVETLDLAIDNTEGDTTRAVVEMRARGCAVVIVLGGDGTNRAAAKGWPDLPVIPVSTGTNNAFPYWVEPTVAGAAAGLLATGAVASNATTLRRAKVVRVTMMVGPSGLGDAAKGAAKGAADGAGLALSSDTSELALIDAVAVADPWVGSLELFDPATMRTAVLTRADPAAIGFSAVGGLLQPCTAHDEGGVLVQFGSVADAPLLLHAPTAPGHYADVGIVECRALPEGEIVRVDGPVLLAFDGERKRRLLEGEHALLCVRRDGPRVVDVAAVMAAAVKGRHFVRQ